MVNLDYNYVIELSKRDSDIKEHLMFLYILPVVMSAQTMVELGAGQSSFALTAAASKTGGFVYSFDLTREAIYRLFPDGEGMLDHHPKFIFSAEDDQKAIFGWNKDIDFLFIDTSHTYEHTKFELEHWGKWVRPGGIIAMHDTSGHWMGCHRAMTEHLDAHNYPSVHFPNQNGFSIIYKI